MRTFFVCLLLLGLSFFSLIPVVHAGGGNDDIASLQAQIQVLLDQIRDLQRSEDVHVLYSPRVPTFEHIALGWDPEQPRGNFVYFRPIIWESFQGPVPNYHGRYDHRLELLRLSNDIEAVFVIMDDKIVSVRGGAGFEDVVTQTPFEEVANSPRIYPEFHSHNTVPSDDHIVGTGFAGKSTHGFYPTTGDDIVIRVGGRTTVKIRFPKHRRIEYHRKVRLAIVSGDGRISFHGYPEFNTPSFLDYARIADTSTDALGLFRISEMVRDIVMIVHEIEEASTPEIVAVRGAPAAPHLLRGDSKRLMSDIVSDMKAMGIQSGHFSLSPRGKKLTTWGALKSAR